MIDAGKIFLKGIEEYIQADALIYQDMTNLVNAIGLKDLCLACLTGKYPTKHAQLIRESIRDNGSSSSGRDYERAH